MLSNYKLIENPLTDEVKNKIFKGFEEQAIQRFGVNGFTTELTSFEIYNDPDNNESKDELIGVAVVQIFWGQLHIKYIFVDEKYRGQGIGSKLMEIVLDFAKKQACKFVHVETMNYQAPEFYKKFDFTLELIRSGFNHDNSMYYFRKQL